MNPFSIATRARILVLTVVMSLPLTTLLSGCGGQSPSDSGDTLQVALEAAPKTLDPRFATDAYGQRITQQLLFSTLVGLDYSLNIAPALATSWEVPEPTLYRFHLRKDARFHDGKPVTAEDVRFTFQHLMAEETGSPYAGSYRGRIESIEVVDPHTVEFHLVEPMASFLTTVIMPILPAHLAGQADFPERLIGSGPFKLVARSPNEIELAANADYFGGAPKVKRLRLKVIKDDNTRFLKAKRGELDLLINALPTAKVAAFEEAPLNEQYRVESGPGLAYNYLIFNLDDAAVASSSVRQAIAYGIDIEEIIEYRLDGQAEVALGLLSRVNAFHEPEVARYPYDPARAVALLEEAGLTDPDGDGPEPRLRLELKSSNNAQVAAIARILQAQLRKVGIELEVRSFEWGTFYGDIKSGRFQLASMRWVGVTEPDFFYDIFHSSQQPPAGRNRGHYQNAEVDALLERGRVSTDAADRKRIYSEVQRVVADELPYVSLWHPNNVSIVHRRVQGYRLHPQGGFNSFSELYVE